MVFYPPLIAHGLLHHWRRFRGKNECIIFCPSIDDASGDADLVRPSARITSQMSETTQSPIFLSINPGPPEFIYILKYHSRSCQLLRKVTVTGEKYFCSLFVWYLNFWFVCNSSSAFFGFAHFMQLSWLLCLSHLESFHRFRFLLVSMCLSSCSLMAVASTLLIALSASPDALLCALVVCSRTICHDCFCQARVKDGLLFYRSTPSLPYLRYLSGETGRLICSLYSVHSLVSLANYSVARRELPTTIFTRSSAYPMLHSSFGAILTISSKIISHMMDLFGQSLIISFSICSYSISVFKVMTVDFV